MSTPEQGPPGYFDPPSVKGRGIRALNRTPILILGGVVLIVTAALGYTLYEREQSIKAGQAHGAAPPAGPATAANVLAHAPNGVIAATLASKPSGLAPKTDGVARTLAAYSDQAPQSPAEMAAQQRRMALEQEETNLAQSKLQSAASALDAGSTVPMAPSVSLAGTPAAATTSATPAQQRGGLLGALAGSTAQDLGGQQEKRDFLADQPPTESDTLLKTREAPLSKYEIRAGTVIPAVMVAGINSDLPGQIIGQVRENVYDTATGNYVLIPQGAKLVGTFDNSVAYGQSRVLVVWKRIIYPNGDALDIEAMPGADQGGYAGLYDQVDNHYVKIFGTALLMSLFSAGVQLSQPQPNANSSDVYSSQQIIAGSVGQQLGNAGVQVIQKGLDIAPTLIIRPGYLFNIMVTKDLVVAPDQKTASR